MAIVHQYTIIYFSMVIQESMSFSIQRNLCLEAVVRFMNHGGRCNFDLSTTEDILQDVATCPKKCSFRIDDLNSYENFSLRKISLTIDEKKTFTFCSRLYNRRVIHINCPWKVGEYMTWDNADAYICAIKDAHCVRILNYCICQCRAGYIWNGEKCLEERVNIGGICERSWQCTGTEFADICEHSLCSCSRGYIKFDRKCCQGNLELNDLCEFTEQCPKPFSVCFNGKCKCINGYSAFDTDSCIKDAVPVGGFCNLSQQCTGSSNSGICENGRCTCAKGFTLKDLACEKNAVPVGGFCNLSQQCTGSSNSGICENGRCTCAKGFTLKDLACEKNYPNSLGIGNSNSQQHETNIGVTLGTLFGGFILGVIVTAVITTLMYRRLKFRTRRREEPDVVFADNRTYGGASDAQISFTNSKKENVATLSPYSFAKETQGYNLSSKQEDERTEDVYNHLREQTEDDGDTYDHACAAQNHSKDLSDYSNSRDAATFRPSPSTDGDDYSTLRH